MNLIIFDIDGTLTHSNEEDSKCFAKAIKDVLQINIDTNWASYRYSTDSGIIKEIYESSFKKEPSTKEINTIQECFFTYLNDACLTDPSLIKPILGADTIFQQFNSLSNWHVAIATGNWKKSALIKLEAAKIPHSEIVKAYADDHIERSEIIKTAIKRAKEMNGVDEYQQIIYVGDRPWDERAAKQLGIGFIGVGAVFGRELTDCLIR